MRLEYKLILDILEPCANMGCVLVLPFASRSPSMVYGIYAIGFHTQIVWSMSVSGYSHQMDAHSSIAGFLQLLSSGMR